MNDLRKIGFPVLTVLIVLVAGYLIAEALGPTLTNTPTGSTVLRVPQPMKTYEITTDDVFALEGLKSELISVKGIQLGDSLDRVVELLGEPELVYKYPTSLSFFYGEKLNLSPQALIIHGENNKVTKIYVALPFNPLLKGSTKIAYDLRGIYDKFGRPDLQEDLPKIRRFTYYERGLEVYHIRKQMLAFALIPSQSG